MSPGTTGGGVGGTECAVAVSETSGVALQLALIAKHRVRKKIIQCFMTLSLPSMHTLDRLASLADQLHRAQDLLEDTRLAQ